MKKYLLILITTISFYATGMVDVRSDKNKKDYPEKYHFSGPIPLIGRYDNPYEFAFTHIILVDDFILKQFIPSSLKISHPKEIYSQIVFYIIPKFFKKEPLNLVFHPFAAINHGYTFSTNIQAGIFNPLNISIETVTAPIALNNLTPLHISVHNGGANIAFSPNNARFMIKPPHNIASFWSYATDQTHATLTFHIILDQRADNDFINFIITEINKIHTVADLKQHLIYINPPDTANKNDAALWYDAHTLILHVLQKEPIGINDINFDFVYLCNTLHKIINILA